ncbi:MAG: CoA transferase [Geminicoccaceae bacterium]|nr:CoA transferase [Geminicoccaceae bacterium]
MADLLAGVRVLDLTNVLAGPFCTYLLAQLGAEVIKVEQPGRGDLARRLGADPALNALGLGASFLAQNAGKRSLTLDLKRAEGRAILERLAGGADVLVENFRPGVMDRLGLGAARLHGLAPRLVICSISGFGADGPLAGDPAYDQIVQGRSGVMAITGDPASAPLRVGFPVADTIGGLTAAMAVVAALFRRERSGKGERIDVSMLEALLSAMGWPVSNWLIGGRRPEPVGNENPTAAPAATSRSGRVLLDLAANEEAQFEALCAVLGRPELARDPRFAEREARERNRAVLRAELEALLAARDAADWAARLARAGVPAGPVLSLEEALAEPHLAAREAIRTVPAPEPLDGLLRLVRAGFRSGPGDPGPTGPPPRLGEHTEAISAEPGLGPEAIADLRARGVVRARGPVRSGLSPWRPSPAACP